MSGAPSWVPPPPPKNQPTTHKCTSHHGHYQHTCKRQTRGSAPQAHVLFCCVGSLCCPMPHPPPHTILTASLLCLLLLVMIDSFFKHSCGAQFCVLPAVPPPPPHPPHSSSSACLHPVSLV